MATRAACAAICPCSAEISAPTRPNGPATAPSASIGTGSETSTRLSRAGLTLHLSERHGDASPGSTAFVNMQGIHAYQQELARKDTPMPSQGLRICLGA